MAEVYDMDGSVFPFTLPEGTVIGGLTKREMFAAMAMQGLCASVGTEVRVHTEEGTLLLPQTKGLPMLAVRYADALIAELDK